MAKRCSLLDRLCKKYIEISLWGNLLSFGYKVIQVLSGWKDTKNLYVTILNSSLYLSVEEHRRLNFQKEQRWLEKCLNKTHSAKRTQRRLLIYIHPLVFWKDLISFCITNTQERKLELSYLITRWVQPNLHFCRNKMPATHSWQ